jgi:type IV secretory pathway VirB2 component (pilin)
MQPRLIDDGYQAKTTKYWTRAFIDTTLGSVSGLVQQSRSDLDRKSSGVVIEMRRATRTQSECFRQERSSLRRSSIGGMMIAGIVLIAATPALAQSPWENAVNALKTSFTGPIATGLSLVAIVVGGLTFAYGEGHSKKSLAGIIFGVGMAIGAVNFMAWMFPIRTG